MDGLRSESGASGLSGTFWILVFIAAIYLGIAYVPAYVESYQVKQVLHEAANNAIREPDDDKVRRFIVEKCRRIGSHTEIRNGEKFNVPGVEVLAEEVYVNRDTDENTIILQVNYDKPVDFPFLDQQHTLSFSPSVEGDLTPVKW